MLVPGMAESNALAETLSPDDAAAYWSEGQEPCETRDLAYPGGAGQPQAARHYRGGDRGVLLFVHGGGWSGGSIALKERTCRRIAARSGWDVVSVSYRLAPAHPYPAGLDDVRAAVAWLRAGGAGIAADRLALGGDSAGGNLALAAALAGARDLAALVLVYGVFGTDFDSDSYRRFATGFGFTRARMMDLYDLYDPEGLRTTDPCLVPMLASDEALRAAIPPATLFLAAECDVLADDTRAMFARFKALGARASLHVEPGVTHGFLNRGRMVPQGDAALDRIASFLDALE
jgi:acetyl esterase